MVRGIKEYFLNKTAIVTGASIGVGYEVVEALAAFNVKVYAIARTKDKLDELKSKYSCVHPIVLDLKDWKETEKQLAGICENVDFLVNNAAYFVEQGVTDITEDEVDNLIAVNLKAPINLTKLVSKGMIERKFGCIVNVSSTTELGAFGQLVYNATKGGLDKFTQVSALELGQYNVRVNAVNPSVILSKYAAEYFEQDTERKESYISKIPMNRFAEVHEIVKPILFLLSEGSSMINGVLMPVDGGFTAT